MNVSEINYFQGGKFLYMDHIKDRPGSWNYYKQKLQTVTGYWKLLRGCNIDREIDVEISNSGLFHQVNQQRIYFAPEKYTVASPHIVGTATKAEE
jgi:hypothetical protein